MAEGKKCKGSQREERHYSE